jgi:hypothetical protein
VTDEDVQDAINAMNSRLGRMEGQLNVITRALGPDVLAEVEKRVRADTLLGQVYLALDGKRTHDQITAYLAEYGISTSRPTVWRRIQVLEETLGLAAFVRSEPSVIHQQAPAAESSLNASSEIRRWLADMGAPAPPAARRRRR